MDSKKPKKQRKRFHSMPLHRRRKSVSSHLGKSLKKELGKRALPVRKGDTVKVMRGSFKGKSAKVSSVNSAEMKVFLEKTTRKKSDGTEIAVPFHPSNLLIESIEKGDEKRLKAAKSTPGEKKEKEGEK